MSRRFSLDQLLSRTGGAFVMIVLAAAQLVALAGSIPGILSVRMNAQFDDWQLQNFSSLVPALILLSNILILFIGWWLTRTARKRLDEWAANRLKPNPKDELGAWREITSITWRQGIAAAVVTMVVIVLPVYLMTYAQSGITGSLLQPTSLISSDPMYVFLGGTVSMFGAVILLILLIERFTLPARLVLLPTDFDIQLSGRAGPLLIHRFGILAVSLITISVFSIAPIGFQQAVQILYGQVNPSEIFSSMRLQSVLFSILAFTLGTVFAYLVSRAISDPINELITTFNKIEAGDLRQPRQC